MIKINKSREPRELELYRQKPDANYSNMPSDVKSSVLESLMKEQGYLCAYCMRKIPEIRELPAGVSPVTIEHWKAQNPEDEIASGQDLDYNNMFAVCAGNRGCGHKKNLTCDAKRGNKTLTVDPKSQYSIMQIKYKSNGYIYSENEDINRDLNEILNLNCEAISLPETRKQVLDALIKDISRNKGSASIDTYCKRKLSALKSDSTKKTYVGILIWWLERHVSV